MKILGIETSCDDTAMAVLEAKGKKIGILSNIISSQIKLHAKYGGVVPSLAAREHAKNIGHVFDLALRKAGIKDFKKEINAIAVTRGPGLGPALLVGISFAKTISWIYKKPLIGINHLEGHIFSNWLKPIGEFSIYNLQFTKKLFPALSLIVSGGHTELVLMNPERSREGSQRASASYGMKNYGKYELIGETLDDAVGEAFDKVARLLGLGYPGGPAVSARAEQFSISSFQFPIKFPRPMEHSKDFNFSYSGLKTAVLYKIRELKEKNIKLTKKVVNELAHAFQEAATDVLVKKTFRAAEKYKIKSLFLSGGVSANKLLRERLEKEATKLDINYFCPAMEYATDNAAMIAMAGYFDWRKSFDKLRINKKTALQSSRGGLKRRPKSLLRKSAVKMDANLGFK